MIFYIPMTQDNLTDSLATGLVGFSISDDIEENFFNQFFPSTLGLTKPFVPNDEKRELCVEVEFHVGERKATKFEIGDSYKIINEPAPSVDIKNVYFANQKSLDEYIAKMGIMADIPMDFFVERFSIADKSWAASLELYPPLDKSDIKKISQKRNQTDPSITKHIAAILRACAGPVGFLKRDLTKPQKFSIPINDKSNLLKSIIDITAESFSSSKSLEFVKSITDIYLQSILDGKVDERTQPSEIVPSLRGYADALSDNDKAHISSYLNRLDDYFLGMGDRFGETNEDNLIHHAFLISALSKQEDEIHRNIANHLSSPIPYVLDAAKFFFELRMRIPATLMSALHSSPQSYLSLNKCVADVIANGDITFNISVENVTELEPAIAISTYGHRIKTQKLALSPALAEIATKVQRHNQFKVARSQVIDECLTVTVFTGDASCPEVKVHITAKESDADLFSSTECDVKKVFKTMKSWKQFLALSTKFRVSMGERIIDNPKEPILEVGRRQPIGTLDDDELLGHLKDISSAVIEMNKLK